MRYAGTYAGWWDGWVEEGSTVIHTVLYIHTSVVHPPPLMLARAASPRHVSPLGTRSMIEAPAAVATDPTRGSSSSHTWRELWREGAVLTGVERGQCRTEVCMWVCMRGCMDHVGMRYAGI
jgi:hypothetical protein